MLRPNALFFWVVSSLLLAACARRADSPPPAWPAPRWSSPQSFPPTVPNASAVSPGVHPAVVYALQQLGRPYCWGGTGPTCFDCSGLTHMAWLAAGRTIPRSSEDQGAQLAEVSLDALYPGDIVWRPGHVGLYVGQGWVVHAPKRGDYVRPEPAARYQRAVRVY